MPSKKKKYNSRFPPARIKKIMQADEEVGKVAAVVPVIICKLFSLHGIEYLLRLSLMNRSCNYSPDAGDLRRVAPEKSQSRNPIQECPDLNSSTSVGFLILLNVASPYGQTERLLYKPIASSVSCKKPSHPFPIFRPRPEVEMMNSPIVIILLTDRHLLCHKNRRAVRPECPRLQVR